jgi:hypothetical protein
LFVFYSVISIAAEELRRYKVLKDCSGKGLFFFWSGGGSWKNYRRCRSLVYTTGGVRAVGRKHLVFYPTPINFSYLNSFGVIAGVFLIIQFLSGIILALFYVPSAEYAFRSVEHIRRDVTGG